MINVVVNPKPATPMPSSDVTVICAGETLSLFSNVTDPTVNTLKLDGPERLYRRKRRPDDSKHHDRRNGRLWPVVTTQFGCVSDMGVSPAVKVNPTPAAPDRRERIYDLRGRNLPQPTSVCA